MEKEIRVPETRVIIDQSELPEEMQTLRRSTLDIGEHNIQITIDKFGSADELTSGLHKSSHPYHTYPRAHPITNSAPVLPQDPSTAVYTPNGKSQSSYYLTSTPQINRCTNSVKQVETSAPVLNGKQSHVTPPDRASSPDELTCDSGMDDHSLADDDKLRLKAACLEGRLAYYSREAETWLRERAELSSEAASLRKRLDAANSNLREVKIKSDQKVAEALSKSREAQESLRQAQAQLDLKTRENEELTATLSAAQKDSMKLKSQLTDVQQNSVAKDQALVSLRSKMAELYADMESIRMAHSQALDNKTDLNAELASLKRSQSWYKQQLQLTEATRDRLMDQLNSMRKWLDQSGSSAQQLAQENARLENQVMSGEAALAEAKLSLTRELQVIRADIMEREAIFEKIVAERAELEALCQTKSYQITECQNRITALQSDLNDTEVEVSSLRAALDNLRNSLQCVEAERDNLRSMVSNLESQVNQQNAVIDQQVEQYKEIYTKLTRLEGSSYEQTNKLNRALEEKAALESSLQAVYKEKVALDACFNQLKDDLTRVETNYSSLQGELEAKNSELSSVLLIRDELSSDLEVVQGTLQEKMEKVRELEAEREQLQNASVSLRTENEGLREDLKRLDASIAPACEEAANKAREPLITEVNRLTSESSALQKELAGLREQVASLLAEQERLCNLMASHQTLEQQYETLNSTYTAAVEEAAAKQNELNQRLQQVEASYSKAMHTKSAEIDSLRQQLDAKVKEALALQSEIASSKASHQEALENQATDWAQKMSHLEARLQATESQRRDVEHQLQAVLEREREASLTQQAELQTVRAEVSKLESRVAKSEGLQTKNRTLMFELEAARGREMGLNDTLEHLKRHASNLETTLLQKETELVELADKAEAAFKVSAQETVPIQPVKVEQHLTASAPMPCRNCQVLSAEMAMHTETVSRMQNELAKVQAQLELTKQELAAQSIKTANEAFGRQAAVEAQRQSIQEVERLKQELAEFQQQLSDSKHIASTAQANVERLSSHVTSTDMKNTSEVYALQETVQVLTRHLEQLKRELADTKAEAWHYQSHLSDLRGSLRGLIEQSRLFSNDINTPDSSQGTSTGGPASVNVVDANELEKLLVDRAGDSLLHSKPLKRVNNYLERLQKEIDLLECQVVRHAAVVRDNVANWRAIEEHAILVRTSDHPYPPQMTSN